MAAPRVSQEARQRWVDYQEKQLTDSMMKLGHGRSVQRRIWKFIDGIPGHQPKPPDFRFVFLSHHLAGDASEARRYEEAFKKLGVIAAAYDPELPWNDPVGEIGLRIALADALVLLQTSEDASPWVIAEVKYARSKGVPVVSCQSLADVGSIVARLPSVVRNPPEPLSGFAALHYEELSTLLSAVRDAKQLRPDKLTYGDVGRMFMVEEARLRDAFLEPLRFEYQNPSNQGNRFVAKLAPTAEEAWMQSPTIFDLYSASHFFLEGETAFDPLPNLAIARLWPMRVLNWLKGLLGRSMVTSWEIWVAVRQPLRRLLRRSVRLTRRACARCSGHPVPPGIVLARSTSSTIVYMDFIGKGEASVGIHPMSVAKYKCPRCAFEYVTPSQDHRRRIVPIVHIPSGITGESRELLEKFAVDGGARRVVPNVSSPDAVAEAFTRFLYADSGDSCRFVLLTCADELMSDGAIWIAATLMAHAEHIGRDDLKSFVETRINLLARCYPEGIARVAKRRLKSVGVPDFDGLNQLFASVPVDYWLKQAARVGRD